jgi:nitrate/nitrite transport system substrate-binding protein
MSKYQNRRFFLQGMGATAGAIAFYGCTHQQGKQPNNIPESALAVEPIIKPETLEKRQVGQIPETGSFLAD